jgi:hypothetical protein
MVTRGHGEKRTRRREQAVAALLSEPSIKAAAAKVGVNECTLRAWLADPEFKAEFRAAGRAVLSAAVGKLQSLTSEAVTALGRNLKTRRPADQLRAIDLVLGHVVRLAELCDLTDEVLQLKRALSGGNDAADAAEGS